jgi:hypothetical protein
MHRQRRVASIARALVWTAAIVTCFVGVGRAGAQDPPGPGPAPGSTGAPSSAAAGPVGASSAAVSDETPEEAEAREKADFNREILTVEQDVTKLKERVFRSKATLQLLRELVLEGSSLGSHVVLWHVNRMGAAYSLESVQYFVDGKNVFSRQDTTGGLDQEREFQILDQNMAPGEHNLQVAYTLRGNGYGVFSYLRSYSFKVQSSYAFNVEDGRETVLRIIADEKGGPWRTFVDRPNVQYELSSERMQSAE